MTVTAHANVSCIPQEASEKVNGVYICGVSAMQYPSGYCEEDKTHRHRGRVFPRLQGGSPFAGSMAARTPHTPNTSRWSCTLLLLRRSCRRMSCCQCNRGSPPAHTPRTLEARLLFRSLPALSTLVSGCWWSLGTCPRPRQILCSCNSFLQVPCIHSYNLGSLCKHLSLIHI